MDVMSNKINNSLIKLKNALLNEKQLSEDIDEGRFDQINKLHEQVIDKYEQIKNSVVKRNTTIKKIELMIDSVPSPSELIQFEKRFLELGKLSQLKGEETKSYYNKYNMLQTTYTHSEKHLAWMNSLIPFLESELVSKYYKKGISIEIKNILDQLNRLLTNQRNNINEYEKQKNKAEGEYRYVVDEQRKYYMILREFQIECNKNEELQLQLHQLQNENKQEDK